MKGIAHPIEEEAQGQEHATCGEREEVMIETRDKNNSSHNG